jgi:hypothetical protein
MSPLEAAMIVIPTATSVVAALYIRAKARKIDAAIALSAEKFSVGPILRNVANLQSIPATTVCNIPSLHDITHYVNDLAPGYIGGGRGTSWTMKDRATAILAGLHESIGAEGPATTPEDRERLAWPYRAARSLLAIAGLLGITLVAADLPPEDPQMLVVRTLFYRDDQDAAMWILFGLAGEICLRDDIDANEADRWLLASCLGDRLSDDEPLFDRAARSAVRDARA